MSISIHSRSRCVLQLIASAWLMLCGCATQAGTFTAVTPMPFARYLHATANTSLRSPGGALAGFPPGPAFITGASSGMRSSAAIVDIVASAPAPPQIGIAVAGNTRIRVTFTAPADDGGSPITGYVATASPGGATVGCAAPCDVLTLSGLVNHVQYTVTVQAINAIGISAPSTVSNPVIPSMSVCAGNGLTNTITLQQGLSCPDSHNAALLASASGGQPPYSYSWVHNGSTDPLLSGIGPGSYANIVTDDLGCVHAPTFHLVPPPTLVVHTSVIMPAAPRGSCNGSAGATAGGGTAPYEYAWTPSGQSGASATALCAGAHGLTVIDANQCIAQATVNIIEPPSAPVIIDVVPGDAQVSVLFTPADGNGGAPIQVHRVTCGSVTVDAANVPTIVSGLANGVAVTCSVRAFNAAGGGDVSAASAPVTPRAPQSIVFGLPPDLHVGQTGTVTAMGGASGNPVTLDARTPTICSIDANSGLVTAVEAGVCTIAANQAGGAAYLPAPESLLTFDIADVRFLVTPSALLGTIAPAAPQWVEEGERATFEITPGTSGMQSRVEGSCGGTLTGTTVVTEPITQDCTVIARFFTVPMPSNTVTPVPIEGGIRFEFTPQYDGGSPILDFTLTCDPGAWSITAPAPPITLTGLIDHAIYRCRLRARNAAGLSPLQSPFTAIPGSIGDTADIGISIDNGTDFIDGGQPVVYTMTVTNHGPGASYFTGAEVLLTAELPSGDWTCEAQGGGHCRSTAGPVDAGMVMDLARNGSVRYRVRMTPAPGPETPLSIVASAEGFRVPDPDLTNNVASDGPDIRGIFRNGME